MVHDANETPSDEVKRLTENWIAKGGRLNNPRALLTYLQKNGANIKDVASVIAELLKTKDEKLRFEVVKFILSRYDVAKGGNGKAQPVPSPDQPGEPDPIEDVPLPRLDDES